MNKVHEIANELGFCVMRHGRWITITKCGFSVTLCTQREAIEVMLWQTELQKSLMKK